MWSFIGYKNFALTKAKLELVFVSSTNIYVFKNFKFKACFKIIYHVEESLVSKTIVLQNLSIIEIWVLDS